MSNVIGPICSGDWNTMLLLRKDIDLMLNNYDSKYDIALHKEQELYKYYLNKYSNSIE